MFVLPELKRPYNDFEPHIDAATMEIHHQKHHAGYVKKLNQAMVDNDINTERIEDIFENISQYPDAVRNNAGGHYNHSVFWASLCTSMSTPSEELGALIASSFGLLEDLKTQFIKESLGVFGSGWCWLVVTPENTLKVVATKNQDNPLMDGTGYPLFGIDVWEHAYYLNYQNKRVDYLYAIWGLLNWAAISRRFENRPEMNEME